MKNLFVAVIICLSLIWSAPVGAYGEEGNPRVGIVSADSVPLMVATVVGTPLACYVKHFDADSKKLLNKWLELNAKRDAGIINDEEFSEGSRLAVENGGICGVLPENTPVTVKIFDGLDYFVVGETGMTFIIKVDGLRFGVE